MLRIYDISLERSSSSFYDSIRGDAKIKLVSYDKWFVSTSAAFYLFSFPSLTLIKIIRLRQNNEVELSIVLDIMDNNDAIVDSKDDTDILHISFETRTLFQTFKGILIISNVLKF